MYIRKSAEIRQYTDLHDRRVQKTVVIALLFCLGIMSILARTSLVHFWDPDYGIFASWYDFVKIHGIHSFKFGADAGFSNYNPPYSYFLYIVTLLPLSKMLAIKSLLAFFDIIMAISVYFVASVFRSRLTALTAAMTALFLPTVLVNGVMWGQFDQLYVAAMLLSLYFALKDNGSWSWVWFGIAIAVKLQAIFFLPVLAMLCFKRIKWGGIVWGILAFLILTLPPIIAGRSIESLLNIYPAQVSLFNGYLVLNAPTLYQWFPNSAFPYLNHAGTMLAIAASIMLLLYTIANKKFTNKEVLIATTLVLYLVPFLLPAMHERYFFPAGIASLILAFIYPNLTNISTAAGTQVITLLSYLPFLFGKEPPIPFPVLSALVLLIISGLIYEYSIAGELDRTPLVLKNKSRSSAL